jgi:hypothetical protein
MMDSRILSRQQAYSTRIGKSNGLASPVFKSRVVGYPEIKDLQNVNDVSG